MAGKQQHYNDDGGEVEVDAPPTSFYFDCEWCGEDITVNAQDVKPWHDALFCTEVCQLAHTTEVVPTRIERIKEHIEVLKRICHDLETRSKRIVGEYVEAHPGNEEVAPKKRARFSSTSPRYNVDEGSAPMPIPLFHTQAFSLNFDE